MHKQFSEEQKLPATTSVSHPISSLDSPKRASRSELKQQAVSLINNVFERILKDIDSDAELLLLQYGSAFFEADDTDESDFDILMVSRYSEMEKFMKAEGGSRGHGFDISEVRAHFFFGRFFSELGREPNVEVYAADRARIPQIKLTLATHLQVDLSFAIVSNLEFNRDQNLLLGNSVVAQLDPMDSCSLLEIQAVRGCELIKEFVEQFVP